MSNYSDHIIVIIIIIAWFPQPSALVAVFPGRPFPYSMRSSMNSKWFIFRCPSITPSPSWYFVLCCLRICVSGIIAMTNSGADEESPWNISHLTFTLPGVVPSTVISVLQFSMLYLNNLLMLSATPTSITDPSIHVCGTMWCAFF